MLDLKGRTALVTGSSRGIGRGIAERLAADGALVAVHYGHDEQAARETVTHIRERGGEAFAVGADLSTVAGVDGLLAEAGSRFADGGRDRLDVLVSNAGFSTTFFEATTPEIFDTLFAVNARAPFFLVQRALPLLADGGRVVAVSSAAVRVAVTDVAYTMAKAAVVAMNRTLAHLLGERGITVNTVAPGAVDTDLTAAERREQPETRQVIIDMTALGRIGTPADVADVVAFLASDDARWVTGQLIEVSGGLFLGLPPGLAH
ncbi:SDR family NAD(P)-dependent oxidoreductase [Streptomyces rugosispiralis]|uniref:SDR family oxidoreductase n=1 Tax=Streptomyces rugosispiralis TaxID=2967341 RepID=A0ABT1V8R3_9ACTN|nr:SDR family oxidoreductase [Streptomyces rugosispiralis]MCQ8193767.1 SDR family oxidoreductase [Streptomyces rugosispiralis]